MIQLRLMMKIKFPRLLLIACAFFAVACENQKTKNVQANQNELENSQNVKTESNQILPNVSATIANNSAEENSDTETNAGTSANDDKIEFTGTAGITDKKNQVKGVIVLKKVRTAGHSGYDRVVFEFEGAEMPSYHIEYIDKPVRACGSGHVVPLRGDGWLEIRFTPAAAHTEEGKPTVENRERSPNLKIIREMKSTCDFEAEVAWVLGVASPNRYRVLELKNPTRLAIDIKH